MVNKIGHYALENPASVYDEESMSAIELAGRTARKVNECIDVVNEADEYMRKNLTQTVSQGLQGMADDGTLGTELVKTMASTKVDKGGLGQVTYAMLAQDARLAMTGGNTPVVGTDAVSTVNIVDKAVTEAKLHPTLRQVFYHSTTMDIPVVVLDGTAKTGIINPNLTENIKFYVGDSYYSVKPTEVQVDVSDWDGSNYFKLFYSTSLKVIKVTAFEANATGVGDYLYLGRCGWTVTDNVIPVQVNDRYFCASSQVRLMDAPVGLKPIRISLERYRRHDNAVFNVDTATGKITIVKGGNYTYYAMHQAIPISFTDANLVYSAVDFTKSPIYVWHDPNSGKIHFMQSITDIPRWWGFLGLVSTNQPHTSTCVVPFTVNEKYYYHPDRNRREWAKVVYSPYSYETKTVPYVDFENKKLVFPSVSRLYLNTNEDYITLFQSTGENYEVPFESTDNPYQYLVGGVDGLKFVTPSDFKALLGAVEKDGLFYLGYCIQTDKVVDFTFECVKGRTLSVVGDSISTFGGYIPTGNTAYYTDNGSANVNMMWWKRAMNRCGLSLCVNNSNSGSRVTNTATDGRPYGIEMVKNLSNGTAPDVIVIYMGVNDYNTNVALGTYNGKGAIPTAKNTFREGYAQMLYNALKTYPQAKVYACTLPALERTTGDITSPDKNSSGVYLTEYNEAIRELAKAFCVEVIDLESCGINHYNGSAYMYDYEAGTGAFLHPNAEGHRMLSHKVIKALLDSAE